MDVYEDEKASLEYIMDVGSEELNTSTPVEKQDADKVSITLREQWRCKDDESQTITTPRRSLQKKSPSPLQLDHDDTLDGTSSPKPSMHNHIKRCMDVISSTNRSEWLMNEEEGEGPLVAKGEMKLEELNVVDSPKKCDDSIRTPPRSTERAMHTYGNAINTPRRGNDIYVNVTDDIEKNPILASSVRSMKQMREEQVDQADVERSLKVLGASRCWTDRFDEDLQETIQQEDYDLLATQTPIRSLTSYLPTSHSSYRCDSMCMSPSYPTSTSKRNEGLRSTPNRASNITGTPNRYTRSMFASGDAIDLEAFNGARLADMRLEEVNPMAYATLCKALVSEARMGEELATLYKHFKNMCTFIRRASMRNDRPYFKVVQLMVQRMTRKSFKMEQLKQMAWLAPNLISFKWVNVSDMVRKKYSIEYRDCTGEVVHDVQIRIHKLDGKMCTSTKDFENTCLAFKTIICAWVAREEAHYLRDKGSTKGFHPEMALPIPTVTFQNPQSDGDSLMGVMMSPPTMTPSRLSSRLPHRMSLDTTRSTAMLSSSNGSTHDISQDIDTFKSPVKKPSMKHLGEDYKEQACASEEGSNKRSREETMLPISMDLLDTPGMRRIRENAKRLSQAANTSSYEKMHDISYWKDVKWFLNALVQLSVDEERPPFMRLEWLADFINKHSSRSVTYDKVVEWANTLSQLAPDILDVGVSKFDDYSTILTLHPNAKFDRVIQYLNCKIDLNN